MSYLQQGSNVQHSDVCGRLMMTRMTFGYLIFAHVLVSSNNKWNRMLIPDTGRHEPGDQSVMSQSFEARRWTGLFRDYRTGPVPLVIARSLKQKATRERQGAPIFAVAPLRASFPDRCCRPRP